jgi:hypothetical protein
MKIFKRFFLVIALLVVVLAEVLIQLPYNGIKWILTGKKFGLTWSDDLFDKIYDA